MKKNQNLHFLTTFFNVISHENPKFNHFLCKMYINISNTGCIAFHNIHIYINFFFTIEVVNTKFHEIWHCVLRRVTVATKKVEQSAIALHITYK